MRVWVCAPLLALSGVPGGALASAAADPASFAPPPGAAFLQVWQKEVLEGRIREAAEEYAALYGRAAASAAARTPMSDLDRVRAAYRAGICFEALGNAQRAALAYRWIERKTHQLLREPLARTDPARAAVQAARLLWDEASLRLRRLEARSATEPASADPALAEVTRELELAVRREAAVLERLRQETLEARRRARAVDELVESLEARGVAMAFLPLPPAGASRRAAVRDLFAVATSEAWASRELCDLLAERFYVRALRQAVAHRIEDALCECEHAFLVRPEDPAVRRLAERLERSSEERVLESWARRRLEEHAEERASRLRGELRARLAQAGTAERDSRALRDLARLQRLAFRESRHVLADPEVAASARRLEVEYLLTGGSALEPRLRAVVEHRRETLEETVALAEELVVLARRDLVRRRPAEPAPAREERSREAAAVLAESAQLHRSALRAEEEGDRLLADLELFKARRLREWFPRLADLIEEPRRENAPVEKGG